MSLHAGGKLIIAGNGGSAADAQHLAAEFLSTARTAAIAGPRLDHRHSVLTAMGNDYGFVIYLSVSCAGWAARRCVSRNLNIGTLAKYTLRT